MTGMRQEAAYPQALAEIVKRLHYRPGWRIRLDDIDRGQGSSGLTLVITTKGYDAYHPERGDGYRVDHYMIVPAAAYDERSWTLWVFRELMLVEQHECMEFFQLLGRRPFAPAPGPGNDPYMLLIHGTDADRRTRFTGEVAPG